MQRPKANWSQSHYQRQSVDERIAPLAPSKTVRALLGKDFQGDSRTLKLPKNALNNCKLDV